MKTRENIINVVLKLMPYCSIQEKKDFWQCKKAIIIKPNGYELIDMTEEECNECLLSLKKLTEKIYKKNKRKPKLIKIFEEYIKGLER